MHRVDGPGATAANLFQAGNPFAGIPATQVTPEIMNALQEEIAGVVEDAGLTLDKADNTQLLAALAILILRDSYVSYTTTPAVTAGDVLYENDGFFGVQVETVGAGETATVRTAGNAVIAKKVGDTVTEKDELYWDPANSHATITQATGFRLLGYAVAAAGSAADTVNCHLQFGFYPEEP